jgi:hypothetical protein
MLAVAKEMAACEQRGPGTRGLNLGASHVVIHVAIRVAAAGGMMGKLDATSKQIDRDPIRSPCPALQVVAFRLVGGERPPRVVRGP